MEITKTMYAIRHKESGLFFKSSDTDYDRFVEFSLGIDLYSNYTLDDIFICSDVIDNYKEMFSKYLTEEGFDLYFIPKEDLELVEFEYSLKQK